MIKNLLAIFLSLCMLFSAVGCGGSQEGAVASSNPSSGDFEDETYSEEYEEDETEEEFDEDEEFYEDDEDEEDDSSKGSSKKSSKKSSSKKSSKKSSSKSSSKKSSSKKSSSKKSSNKSSSKKSSSNLSSSLDINSSYEEENDNYESNLSSGSSSSRPAYIGSGNMDGVRDPGGEDSKEVTLWSSPESFAIIYPADDDYAREAAMRVRKYFEQEFSVTLPVVSDGNDEIANEILVGKTNRDKSDKTIAQNSYKVSMKGKNLVFDGGHSAALDQAVQLFVDKAPKSSGDVDVSGSLTNFKPKMLGEYDYVWGDEFVTNELDFSRWTLAAKMGGTDTIKVSSSRQTIDMVDGNLVLRAIKGANKLHKEYLVPTSVVTQFNMMYTYGYCEIRAKVPNEKGIWPSFWTQSNTGVGDRKCFNYFVEVDIFEVFGDPDGKIIPNLHKWYNKDKYDYATLHNAPGVYHTTSGNYNKKVVLADSGSTYHTYGYEWTPTEMSMYVDGEKYITYDITKCYNNDKSGEMKGFHDPQFLIFNNHVFAKDASFIANYEGKPSLIENNESVLPCEYIIDYFRLYQKKGEGKIWTSSDVKYTYPER